MLAGRRLAGWRLDGLSVRDVTGVGKDGLGSGLSKSFLLLHPSVLEPDLDLCLVQTQDRGNLDPASPCQVLVEVKLLFQLRQLLVSEVGSAEVDGVVAELLLLRRLVVQLQGQVKAIRAFAKL